MSNPFFHNGQKNFILQIFVDVKIARFRSRRFERFLIFHFFFLPPFLNRGRVFFSRLARCSATQVFIFVQIFGFWNYKVLNEKLRVALQIIWESKLRRLKLLQNFVSGVLWEKLTKLPLSWVHLWSEIRSFKLWLRKKVSLDIKK